MESVTEILKKIPLFAELSDDELQKIGELARIRRYKKNMFVFVEGEPGEGLCFIKKGKVKISKLTEDGREQILHILGEGEVFAEVVLFDAGSYPATAEVIEEASIGMVRNSDVEELIKNNAEIALHLLKIMSKRLRQAHMQIRDLALKDTYGRMASMLFKLAQDYGTEIPGGVRISLSLSRQELANMIGTSRETVTRILSEFKRQNVIDLDRQEIVIVNPTKLKTWL